MPVSPAAAATSHDLSLTDYVAGFVVATRAHDVPADVAHLGKRSVLDGIGLALARSLVELHGGAIWAESTVGSGSRFTFSLPIAAVDRRTGAGMGAAPKLEEAEEESGDRVEN